MNSKIDEDIVFIKTNLLPEMVYNRCFCEPGSREFVEFDSAEIEPQIESLDYLYFSSYHASVTVCFSGEPEVFHIVIKLLPENCFTNSNLKLAFNGFLNEEILWNKGTLQFGKNFLPKFYVADMGIYGRPVIVVEDLQKNGYHQVIDREFNQQEILSLANFIGDFHGKAMRLKQIDFAIFREFYAKFQDTVLSQTEETETCRNISEWIEKLKLKERKNEKWLNFEKILGQNPFTKCKEDLSKEDYGPSDTICQGLLIQKNIWFRSKKTNDNQEKLEVKVFDWQKVKRGPSSLDLATILIQSNSKFWSTFLETYTKAVQKEQSFITKKEICNYITDTALLYAFIILSKDNRQPKLSQFCNMLSYEFL